MPEQLPTKASRESSAPERTRQKFASRPERSRAEVVAVWYLQHQALRHARKREQGGEAGASAALLRRLDATGGDLEELGRVAFDSLHGASTRREFTTQLGRFLSSLFLGLAAGNARTWSLTVRFTELLTGRRCDELNKELAALKDEGLWIARENGYSLEHIDRVMPLVDWCYVVSKLGERFERAPRRGVNVEVTLPDHVVLQWEQRFLRTLLQREEERRRLIIRVGIHRPDLALGNGLLARELCDEVAQLRTSRESAVESELCQAAAAVRAFVRDKPKRCPVRHLHDASDVAEYAAPAGGNALLGRLSNLKLARDPRYLRWLRRLFMRYFGHADTPEGRRRYAELLFERIAAGWYDDRPLAAVTAIANVIDLCRLHPVELRECRQLAYDHAGSLGGGEFRDTLERYEGNAQG